MKASPVDVVLLDVMMPEMDGYAVLEHRREDPDTARDSRHHGVGAGPVGGIVRCIELGAEDYLAKPFDPVLLKARVTACLEKKRLRDAEENAPRNRHPPGGGTAQLGTRSWSAG